MMNLQNYAIDVERIMRGVFDCERFDIGNLVNSDYIRHNPYISMVGTLMYLCGKNEKNSIENVSEFLGQYSDYSSLSFEEIEREYSEEKIKEMIQNFSELCSKFEK